MHRVLPRYYKSFSIKRQITFWLGKQYHPREGEFLLNLGRSGIALSLKSCLKNGGRVGMMAYNCSAVANAIIQSGCIPVFIDVTHDFLIDLDHLSRVSIDALIVTNLFGIKNDITAIRNIKPNIPIIVDNAMGYGLPHEGDYTIYSINQGKYPSLSDGGILYCNKTESLPIINKLYAPLPQYSFYQNVRLFIRLLRSTKNYNLYYRNSLKFQLHSDETQDIVLNRYVVMKMSKGSSRLYYAWLKEYQKSNHIFMPFMDIVTTDNPNHLKAILWEQGYDAGTIFKNWPQWAIQIGYQYGQCPTAEFLTTHRIMIPNYYKRDVK